MLFNVGQLNDPYDLENILLRVSCLVGLPSCVSRMSVPSLKSLKHSHLFLRLLWKIPLKQFFEKIRQKSEISRTAQQFSKNQSRSSIAWYQTLLVHCHGAFRDRYRMFCATSEKWTFGWLYWLKEWSKVPSKGLFDIYLKTQSFSTHTDQKSKFFDFIERLEDQNKLNKTLLVKAERKKILILEEKCSNRINKKFSKLILNLKIIWKSLFALNSYNAYYLSEENIIKY